MKSKSCGAGVVIAITLMLAASAGAQVATTEAEVRAAFDNLAEKHRDARRLFSRTPGAKGLHIPPRMETQSVTTVTDEDLRMLGSRSLGARNIVPTPRKRPVNAPRVDVLIPFKINSHELAANAATLLDEVVKILKAEGNDRMRLAVNGHTDRKTGDLDFNMKLSHLRAAAVLKYLVDQGRLPRERFEGHGYGPTAPRFDESTPDGIEKNRRVEFELLTEK